MNAELPEHVLETLRDVRVTGPQTPGHAVMARGRVLRRRRRASGGAALAGVAMAGTALAAPMSPFALGGGRPAAGLPAAGVPAPSAAPTGVPRACAVVPAQGPVTPRDAAGLLHLVDPAHAGADVVMASLRANDTCAPPATGGMRVSAAGTVEESWVLRGPMDPDQLSTPAGGRQTTVLGSRGEVLESHGSSYVTWTGRNGDVWVLEGHGIPLTRLRPLADRVRIDDRQADPRSLPSGYERATVPQRRTPARSWDVSYGDVNEDGGGWTLHVSEGTGGDEPGPISARPGDEVRQVAGHRVLFHGTGGGAVWTEGGLTFSITGSIGRARAIEAIRHLRPVTPDDPRVLEALRQAEERFPPEPTATGSSAAGPPPSATPTYRPSSPSAPTPTRSPSASASVEPTPTPTGPTPTGAAPTPTRTGPTTGP